MLQAHSLLWHYLWVAPNFLLLALAFLCYKRGLHKKYPGFFAFAVLSAIAQLAVYVADVAPPIGPGTWWRIFWVSLLVEGVLKFFLIGEIFNQTFHAYASVARMSRILIRGVGAALILASALLAALAPQDGLLGIVAGAHSLERAIYLVESGLLVFVFLLAAHFRLHLQRPVFGIALGLSISACVHLATWAVLANGGLPDSQRILLVFVNMATYHACVLIWFYFLLLGKTTTKPTVPLPEHNLEIWNREMERLIH